MSIAGHHDCYERFQNGFKQSSKSEALQPNQITYNDHYPTDEKRLREQLLQYNQVVSKNIYVPAISRLIYTRDLEYSAIKWNLS